MTALLDPDRRLALAYVPATKRPAVETLWLLDATLGAVLATGRDRMVSRIRLAWWREALEKLDGEAQPPEPLLQALAAHVVPTVSGAELSAMEEGWAGLLDESALGEQAMQAYARLRGGLLFRYSARLLGRSEGPANAGRCWALLDLARRSSNGAERNAAIEAASNIAVERSASPALRPLTMLAALAQRDIARGPESLEQQGSPSRMMRMIVHRLTGR